MAPTAKAEFEIWGDPVEHSLSPALHRAAYRVLGLEWSYRYRTVSQELITPAWVGVGAQLGGISLTMPLKERILDLVALRDPIVERLQAANTVYRHGEALRLSNTDPYGVERALERFSVQAERAWILGAGATARSVGYALGQLGVSDLTLFVRNPERAERTAYVLRAGGQQVQIHTFDEVARVMPPELVASTLPGNADSLPDIPSAVIQNAALFDVAYSPWPSAYATHWSGSERPVVHGLWMLAYQALAQIRLFLHGDSSRSLPKEEDVFAAMLEAVGLSTD